MSLVVSYKKQFGIMLILIISILIVVETSARIYEFFIPECFYLNADASQEMHLDLRKQICEQSKLVKTIEFPVFQYEPNQSLYTININSFGFRGADFNEIKDDDTYRIFMVGGSTTFGSGSTSDETTIPAFLEKKFIENNLNVEVINAGVGAADSMEEAYKIRHIYKKYDPDHFIVYDGWNDSFTHLNPNELNPSISRSENLESKKSFIQLWISENLQMYRTIYVLYPIFSHYSISSSLNDDVYKKNYEIWKNRWSKICDENNMDGIQTSIFLQPVVGSGNKKLTIDEKRHADYIKGIKTREQLDVYSNVLPIESCTASFDIRNSLDGVEKAVYYDGGHLNDYGNYLIANKIYEKILPIISNDIKLKK